ncbi:tripartite motif-containing protein 2-like [Lingula anatina]|uniref:Tripartite motif-containing protein 2-like n=1 Tax=Lingula anatina TaxID=7574 RepID=A0A2R2MMQ4_LINAN|nr:tripartite motif-containing protein 2-like [Lingula anatina]|eukprot:XP_023931513.1 tripartite motif-containing protein 2-like [Lingula anatina]
MSGQMTEQSQPTLAEQGTNQESDIHPSPLLEKAVCVHSFNPKQKGTENISISGLDIYKQHIFLAEITTNRTLVFTDEGHFQFDIKVKSPYNVAVSQTGHLYITSPGDKCVKVYSTIGQQVTTMGQGQLEMPSGITLNREGHVMVCDMIEKSIFTFHASSGQLMDIISLSKCIYPAYITMHSVNDNIVISDWGTKSVHVLSPTGDQLYQYVTRDSGDGQLKKPDGDSGDGQLKKPDGDSGDDQVKKPDRGSSDVKLSVPHGVCTDNHGHIFVADFLNHRIVALNPQGEFVKYIVTKDDGLKYPTALAINPAGQLVVAEQWGKVKTFQYLQ